MVKNDKISGNAQTILEIAIKCAEHSEFNAANLVDICRLAQRHGITGEQTQQCLAMLKHQKKVGGEVIGHSFYILINPLNLS